MYCSHLGSAEEFKVKQKLGDNRDMLNTFALFLKLEVGYCNFPIYKN